MNLQTYILNNQLKIKVIPNSDRTELKEQNGELKLYLQAQPEKGKANLAIIKFFKKELGLRVEIVYGEKRREKRLRIVG